MSIGNPLLDSIRDMLPEPVRTGVEILGKYASVLLPIAQGLEDGVLTADEVVALAKKAMTAASDAQMKAELGA